MSKSADGYKSPSITYSLLRHFSESDLVIPIDNDDWLVRFLRPCKYYPDSAFELVSKFIFAHWIDQWHKYRANVPSWLLECDLNRRNVNANWKLSLAGLSIELFQFVFNFVSIFRSSATTASKSNTTTCIMHWCLRRRKTSSKRMFLQFFPIAISWAGEFFFLSWAVSWINIHLLINQ